jgi:hypothetical protein
MWGCDFCLDMAQMMSSGNEIKEGATSALIETIDPILGTNGKLALFSQSIWSHFFSIQRR